MRGKGPSWVRYAVAFGIGLVIFLILAVTRGAFSAEDPAEKWTIICDALFVPGALLTAFGLLFFASNGGVFDMLRFGVTKALSVMLTKKRRDELPHTFYDYKKEREAKGQAHSAYLIIVGLVFIALAGAALVMYYQFAPEVLPETTGQ